MTTLVRILAVLALTYFVYLDLHFRTSQGPGKYQLQELD